MVMRIAILLGLCLTCAFPAVAQKKQSAVASDFGEKLMKPYFDWKMDVSTIKHKGKQLTLTRYWLKNISYKEAYKKLCGPLIRAGWS